MTQSRDNKPLSADVVVIGGGPAGLNAAAQCLIDGKKVILIEAREKKLSDIRPQLVSLEIPIRNSLEELILTCPKLLENFDWEQDKFYKQLQNENEHIAIKDIQRFIKTIIHEKKESTILYQTIVDKVNVKEKILKINNPDGEKSIHYSHLIVADGLTHHTANLLKKEGVIFEFKKTFESKQKYFVSAYLRLNKIDGSDIDVSGKLLELFPSSLGIDFIYFHRASLEKTQQKQLKFYVTSCISEKDLKKFTENKTEGIEHSIKIARQIFPTEEYNIFPVKDSVKFGAKKDNLKYQIFERAFYEADQAAIQIEKNYIVLVGDAYKSPDFYQGTGANFAILHSTLAAKLINNQITLEEFNKESQTLGVTHLKETQTIEDRFLKSKDKTEELSIFIYELLKSITEKIKRYKDQKKQLGASPSEENVYAKDIEILILCHDIILSHKDNTFLILHELKEILSDCDKKESDPTLFKKNKKNISEGTFQFLTDIYHNILEMTQKKEMKKK